LRKELRKRIDAGELTGMDLARRTGFTQAHISNFLNRKRGLKLSALDRMLKAIGLTVYDLLNPHDLVRFAAAPSGPDEEFADVPVVEPAAAAASAVIVNDEVRQRLKFRRAFLNRLRPDPASPTRKAWTRFVILQVDAREALGMCPRLAPGSAVLVDRHYTTLHPYRKADRNLYAVRKPGIVTVRYVELAGNQLVLRPHNSDAPVELLAIEANQSYSDLLVGRVAQISCEA
jgi:transcriptional regulator with XRE-family HTH domain